MLRSRRRRNSRTRSAAARASRPLLLSSCLALLACGVAASCVGDAGATPLRLRAPVRVPEAGPSGQKIEPAVCSGCEPPLDYKGGPVMATHRDGGAIVVPIYWAPSGRYRFPAGFETAITRFVANVAAASGRTDNVFSVATEYYGDRFGVRTPLSYTIRARPPVVDPNAFPRSGCTPARGYTACITDAQLQAELTRVTASRRLPTGLQYFYPVFLPPGVETAGSDGTTSVDDFCAYHQDFKSGGHTIVYANQPFDEKNCSPNQAPSGNAEVDGVIGIFSHELIEAMTDPLNPPRAWDDQTGNEVADLCANTYGRALGSTDKSDPSGTEYNQVINGGKYYLPQEFSDLAFHRFGVDRGCVQSEKVAESATAAAIGKDTASPQAFVMDAAPTALPADGQAAATIDVSVSDTAGNGLSGDQIHFSVGAEAGTGNCGTLSSGERTTNDVGRAEVVYTASKDDVSCWVVAYDPEGGRAAEAVIYQGNTQEDSPILQASFPSTLRAGGPPAFFTIRATNPSSAALPETLTHFVVLPAVPHAGTVKADQVHLSYSTKGRNGTFNPVPLTGATVSGNAIQGYIGPLRGNRIAPNSSETLTLRIALDGHVPVSKTKPLLALQAFLVQTDPASGSDASLADTNASPVTVPTGGGSHMLRNVLVAIGALLVLVAVIGLLLWRARRTPAGASSPQMS
jgi:hypothetical protein